MPLQAPAFRRHFFDWIDRLVAAPITVEADFRFDPDSHAASFSVCKPGTECP